MEFLYVSMGAVSLSPTVKNDAPVELSISKNFSIRDYNYSEPVSFVIDQLTMVQTRLWLLPEQIVSRARRTCRS